METEQRYSEIQIKDYSSAKNVVKTHKQSEMLIQFTNEESP